MSLQLDARQTELVMSLAKEVSDDIETKPFDVAADRVEALYLVLQAFGATEAAEMARHVLQLLRECKNSHRQLAQKLSELLSNARKQANPERYGDNVAVSSSTTETGK